MERMNQKSISSVPIRYGVTSISEMPNVLPGEVLPLHRMV
jgi:hypothetical protein